MSNRAATRRRIRLRTAAAAALLGSAAAAAAAERRHLRSLAHDEDYIRLTRPLGGRRMRIESDDGTGLNAEAFGPDDAPAVVLAHGWTEQLSFWGPVIERLRRRDLRV